MSPDAVPNLAPFTAASLTPAPFGGKGVPLGPRRVLCGTVPSEWKAAPAIPRALAWKVLRGAVQITYGQPQEDAEGNGGGTLALLSPQTLHLEAGQSFVVWPGSVVLYRGAMEGSHLEWCEP